MSKILSKLKNLYLSSKGFKTKRRLVVIESDDWGSIRMPSKEVFNALKESGDTPQKDAFLSNDCLETSKELNDLYEVLSSVKDALGNPAVITANFAMANPNFDKIDYINGEYYNEPFYQTYKRYYPNEDVLGTVKEGIKKGVFAPQLHCREHMSVNKWMNALKEKKADAIKAFENNMIGVYASFRQNNQFGYMDAFNTDVSSYKELEQIVKDANDMFTKTFGYQSKTFVASCFVWDDEFENILNKMGIKGLQSSTWQNVPIGDGSYKRRLRYTGQKNKNGQIYTARNCSYEPAYLHNPEKCAKDCLEQVKYAFKHNKPAIINSHRLNYIGSINKTNAKENLAGLKHLLQSIKKTYQDVEFITSAQLLEIIK